MSDEVEDDEADGATQMMSSRSLVGEATADALDEEEGDLTVPFDRGKAFAQMNVKPRPAAGQPAAARPPPATQGPAQPRAQPYTAPGPAQPRAQPYTAPAQPYVAPAQPRAQPHIAPPPAPVMYDAEPDLGTGSITVPVARDELPLPSVHEFGDTGEQTVPRRLAPQAPAQRPVPQYDLPPPAYRPPTSQAPRAAANEPTTPQVRRAGSIPPPAPSPFMPQPPPPPQPYAPPLAQMPTPPPQAYAPHMAQMPTSPPQPYAPHIAQVPTPLPQMPGIAPAPSSRGPSLPAAKTRSPPVFVAVMVACTVLTITGLVLLVYLKLRHFW